MKFKSKTIFYKSKIKSTLFPNAFIPSKSVIPEWYKKTNRFVNNQMTSFPEGGINSTFKLCSPVLESLTIGYVITLPIDILVQENNNNVMITWNENPGVPVEQRPIDAHEGFPVPAGHHPNNFIWKLSTTCKVPIGYSFILTHPFNRFDLPFTTLTGIIDGGYTFPIDGKIPFFVKKGFNGIIEKGTPIAQIIPFKIDNWKSKENDDLIVEGDDNNYLGMTKIFGWYKQTWWKKKYFE